MPDKIVFLDIDGVLNGHEWLHIDGLRINQRNAAPLNRIILQTNAELVISSSWRSWFNRNEVTKNGFAWMLETHGIVAPIHDLMLPGSNESGPRSAAILDWIGKHRPNRYVVLDDLPLTVPNLIRPNPAIGLEPQHATTAIQILNGDSP